MLEQSADVEFRHLRQAGVLVAAEKRIAVLPQRLVTVHSRSVVAIQRLRHECRRFAVSVSRIFDDVLEEHQVVGRVQQIRESEIDLALSGGRDLVVMTFDVDADLAEDRRDRVANDRSSVSSGATGT